MQWRWLWVAALLTVLWGAVPAQAETVHLKTGEIIKGRIVRVDQDTLSIESDKGFGVIQVQRSDITLIEYEETERDPSRLVGVGYYHRVNPGNAVASAAEYGVDALSVKMWLSSTDSVDLQLGFYSADTDAGSIYEVFSVDVRYANVFQRRGGVDVYWGASAGYLNVTDKTTTPAIEDTGYRLRAFLGLELFFVSLPNVGISSEIGIGSQTVGETTITNLSTTTFPSFSIRYYF